MRTQISIMLYLQINSLTQLQSNFLVTEIVNPCVTVHLLETHINQFIQSNGILSINPITNDGGALHSDKITGFHCTASSGFHYRIA